MTDIRANRRDLLQASAGLAGASLLGALGISSTRAAEMAKAAGRSEKPLKAAFSNIGLEVSWCTQGKQAAEYWGKLFNVDVTWFDGALSDAKQLAAIEDMANQNWDFVAIQPFSIETLKAPVEKMITAGVPVIDMDTLIAPLDEIAVHSFLAPDNEFMGAAVTQVLMDQIGGQGIVVMTQGASGHTGAQGRARGFESVVRKYPKVEVVDTTHADWSVAKTASIWQALLTDFPKIDAAYFHNDDMALAAYEVMKARGRAGIKIGGCDGMPPALQAVMDGRMAATVRNPSCLIHGGAIIAGVAAATSGEKTGEGPGMIPKHVVTNGPVVTRANAPGLLWMEEHFLI
jgi:ribose transport system substrate-binding protein